MNMMQYLAEIAGSFQKKQNIAGEDEESACKAKRSSGSDPSEWGRAELFPAWNAARSNLGAGDGLSGRKSSGEGGKCLWCGYFAWHTEYEYPHGSEKRKSI